MLYEMDLHTVPSVSMMGQVGQRMGYANQHRSIPQHILILVRSGDMKFVVGEQEYRLTPGMWLYLPQSSPYRVSSQSGCMYVFIHFTLDRPPRPILSSAEDTLPTDPLAPPYTIPEISEAHRIHLPVCGRLTGEQEKVWAMITECDLQRYAITQSQKLHIDLRFTEMLSLLDQRRSRSGMNHYPPVLSRILFFIHEHYADDLTLATLSDAFQLSRQYIMRLFQKHMHTTVTHYLTQLKMNHALELLRHSSFRINEVADMLGYHNTYYFCRLFRQHFGMTPTEYIRHGMRGEQ